MSENNQLAVITARNEVVAKVMFLLVSVILLTGALPQCMLGYHPPADPQGADPPSSTPPPEADPPPTTEHTGRYGQ